MRLLILFIGLCFATVSLAQKSTEKEFSLIQACETGKIDKVLVLLNEGVNVNCAGSDGMTPLHYAVQNGHYTIVKVLVLNDAKIDQVDIDNRTPLLLAVHFDQLDIAEFLVQKGADVNIPDFEGLTPLFYSAAYGDFSVTDMFLFYKGNQKSKDYSGKTPFMVAIWGGFPRIAKSLLDYGANINSQDNEGNTALILAVINQDSTSVDSLIAWNSALETENLQHKTALEVAIYTKNKSALAKLIAAGADVNHEIQRGFNTMDYCLSIGVSKDITSLLVEAGASFNKAPNFKNINFGLTGMFGINDTKVGLRADWYDSRYNFGFQLGIGQRPGRLKVFDPVNDSLTYLFRETRTGLSIGLFKQISIIRLSNGDHIGIRLSANLETSLGDFKASSRKPDIQMYAIPSISVLYFSPAFIYEIGYQYNTAKSYLWNPNALLISISLPLKRQGQ